MSAPAKPATVAQTVIGCGVLLAICIAVPAACTSTCAKPAQKEPAKAEVKADPRVPAPYEDFLAAAVLSKYMRDPESAKFSNVTLRQRRGHEVLCGDVNAKNGFGGYGGVRPFVASNTALTIQGEDLSGAAWDALWSDLCVQTDMSEAREAKPPQKVAHRRRH